ncbi:hypothetical protein Bca52824_014527 [Brassica carinata]|uniref:Uncharacterized protein n=1 Tax=Brassica carinata TaxID=52824 RepID=A0A8X7W0A0_BRACI|nr:hypothetical protein Bca52824_014527 [Brassica carinata]
MTGSFSTSWPLSSPCSKPISFQPTTEPIRYILISIESHPLLSILIRAGIREHACKLLASARSRRDSPLDQPMLSIGRLRPVKRVDLVVIKACVVLVSTMQVIKKANSCTDCAVVSVGKKEICIISRRDDAEVDKSQVIADAAVFSLFVSEEVDKVCESAMFRLTSKDGKLAVERTKLAEQDPLQILDAMLPLYLITSEFASRMSAMSNATDNALELKRNLTVPGDCGLS